MIPIHRWMIRLGTGPFSPLESQRARAFMEIRGGIMQFVSQNWIALYEWISTQHSFPMKESEVPSWDLVPPERIGDKAPFYPNPWSGRAVVTSLCRIDKHH